MQTANALNNVIRILFNPKIEAFKLFDFLIVKSVDTRYLAQITEIYDDKFDSSQNVAKLKIFYKISENNEVMPYDNFTPNKECEILKIKQEEVENFVNLDKETFVFATNVKSETALNIQYDFFNNNPIILADKIECSNTISINIAKKLSEKKHSIILDATGVVEHDCAKKIVACKDIKIPLNFSTIDYIFERCLNNASLEFQVAVGPILNEVKKFAKNQSLEFIPFNAFLRVILEQYKVTPYPELKMLVAGMKKYQMSEIFARYKKDVENLHKTIEKNPVVIIDISSVGLIWQKAYLEYLTDSINEEVYFITRINDENCDIDLINKIYNKRKNISFIPAVSYNYKKLPSIMQYCKNYILMPSLYQRNDFLDANFALSNLIQDGCVLFGENTDNFLYMARDYELAVQEKRKNYKKIVLSMIDKDEEELENENLGEKGDYFENQKAQDSKKLLSELASVNFEENEEQIQEEEQVEKIEEFTEIQNPTSKDTVDEFDEIISKTGTESEIKAEEEIKPRGVIQEVQDIKEENPVEEPVKKEDDKESQALSELIEKSEQKVEDDTDVLEKQEEKEVEISQETDSDFKDILDEEENKNTSESVLSFDNDELVLHSETSKEEEPESVEEQEEAFEFSLEDLAEQNESAQETPKEEKEHEEDLLSIDKVEKDSTSKDEPEIKENKNDSQEDEISFSDEELDFFQMAQEENDSKKESKSDELDLSQVADNALDTSFEDIINSKAQAEKQTIDIDNDTKINEEILDNASVKENLPIFKEEIKKDPTQEHLYEVGNKVSHDKYGIGTVIKIINYEGRQLLQIDFEQAGKKTLEPRIANVKLVE